MSGLRNLLGDAGGGGNGPQVQANEWPFVALEGQTDFALPVTPTVNVFVYRNGLRLPMLRVRRAGNIITLLDPCHAGDDIAVVVGEAASIPTVNMGSVIGLQLATPTADGLLSSSDKILVNSIPNKAEKDLSNVSGFLGTTADFEGSGNPALYHRKAWIFTQLHGAAGPTDARDVFFLRRANYTGGDGGSSETGTSGFVNANHHVLTEIGENVRANEWASLSVIENYAPGFGSPGQAIPQQSASYSLGRKRVRTDGLQVSPTIVDVCEMEDHTVNPAYGSVAKEIDLTVVGPNNTDNLNSRTMLHMVARPFFGSGTGNEIARGYHFTPYTGIHVKTMFKYDSFGGTVGTYFDMPNFSVAANGDIVGRKIVSARAGGDAADAARHSFIIDGVEYGKIYVDASANLILANNVGTGMRFNPTATAFEPLTDNTTTLGTALLRLKQIFCVDATIQTSDATQKTSLEPFSDAELDAIGAVQFGVFRWLNSVESKGDNARVHAGALAQQLAQAFEANGLDPSNYGLWCADEVYEEVDDIITIEEPVMVSHQRERIEHRFEDGRAIRVMVPYEDVREAEPDLFPEFDADGNPIMLPATKHLPERQSLVAVRKMRKAQVKGKKRVLVTNDDGTPKIVLGLRYSELSVMAHAWVMREIGKLSSRLDALEIAENKE